MLQQHATCLQQHLLTTTAKSPYHINQKHENSLQNNNTLYEGITLDPLEKGVDTGTTSSNVALHIPIIKQSAEQEDDDVDDDECINCNKTTTRARRATLALNEWGENAQNFEEGFKAKNNHDNVLSCFYLNNSRQTKAQILMAKPSPLTELKQQQQDQQQQQQTINNMLPQHFLNDLNQLREEQQPMQLNPKLPRAEDCIKLPFTVKDSLDFNSRRRRGRLRRVANAHSPPLLTKSLNFNNIKEYQKTEKDEAYYNVPATKCLNNVAKVLTTLLLTLLLLSFQNLNTFVNNQHKLVLSLLNISKSKSQTLKRKKKDSSSSCISKQIATFYSRCSSSSSSSSSLLSCPASFVSSLSSSVTSIKFLLYAFLFFSSLLILPSQHHHMMAEAAKPKSATQQHQDKPKIAYAAGADNVHIDEEGMLLTPPSYQVVSSQTSNEEETEYLTDSEERRFDMEHESINEVNEEDSDSYEKYKNDTHLTNKTEVIKAPLFPTDLFTKEQLENGAVICHIIGVIYMFVALAIVCDEFFVPSLDVIIEKLGITDDVAGATFMAAGGSAPELFTSVIGVFVSFDDVGIGTIVGSAVFNILFVIGMCALFSKTILTLTWWPLFRDCTFYSISLMVLIYFFHDNLIYWWEALILFSIYCTYVTFMKWNVEVESCVKRVITKNKPGGSVTSRAASESRSGPPGSSNGAGTTGNSSGGNAGSTHTGAKFRHGLLQLMIHTIDPLHDGKVDEKATQLHAIASLKVLLDATKPQRGGATTSAANHVKINLKETTLADRPNGNIDTTLDSPSLSGRRASWIDQRVKIQTRKFSIKQTQEIEDEPEPLSMAWPDTARKRLTYILVAPLLIPMWLTLPDTRTPKGKKLFPVTFIGSIVWIAAFSYLMVWWANVAGDTARIPPEVMGLTFLAAGTSIPDLITSVIVARKGFGDMAVSSSVGSNIFDVTVGLPIPWLIYGLCYGAPVEVNSVGMVCSITILFMMLVFVVMSIACFRWKMNKGLGFTMFLLYFVFVAVSLMFEYDVITCPV